MADVKDIEALLPQTQCGECGYPGCLPYAEALASGNAAIDCCPPGGVDTLEALADLLGVDAKPYLQAVKNNTRKPSVAQIRESECIGCTKCIQACPVDAIVGSAKQMHAILTQECTGCGLCVEPCPVDCIEMKPLPEVAYDKVLAHKRYQARQTRLLREAQAKEQSYQEKRLLAKTVAAELVNQKARQDYILEAIARVKAKKEHE